MDQRTITVTAIIKAKTGKEDQVKDLLLELISPTHAESGCVNYDLHRSTENPGDFVFLENWRSGEALDKHLASSHLSQVRAKLEGLLAEPADIRTWRMISQPKKINKEVCHD